MIRRHWIKGAAVLLGAAFLCAAGGGAAFADNTGTAAVAETAGSSAEESLEAEEPQVKTEMAISSCLITGGNKIQIEASGNGDMENTDGYLYLFELKPYEDAIGERTDYASWANGGASASFSLDLRHVRAGPSICGGSYFTGGAAM